MKRQKYKVEFKDDNQCDAFILTKIGECIHQKKTYGSFAGPKYEQEVLKTVLKQI